jgi:ABC-type antimicrobial peptide transport system permease subunit
MDFARQIVIAILITFPAFYAIITFLAPDQYANSVEVVFNPYTYIWTGLVALIAGFAAVISQTIKVARANPIESLRYE